MCIGRVQMLSPCHRVSGRLALTPPQSEAIPEDPCLEAPGQNLKKNLLFTSNS